MDDAKVTQDTRDVRRVEDAKIVKDVKDSARIMNEQFHVRLEASITFQGELNAHQTHEGPSQTW